MPERNLFFVIDGEVSVCYNKNEEEKIIYKIKIGEFFNEYSFVTGQKSPFYMKALGHTTLLKLSYHDFISILNENSRDHVFIKLL